MLKKEFENESGISPNNPSMNGLPKKILSFSALFLFILFFNNPCFAQPTSQEMSGQERTRELEEKAKALRKQIEEKKRIPVVEAPPAQVTPVPESTQKIKVERIEVTGAAIIPKEEIRKIISPFEKKELTLKEMQKAADLITDYYRQKGYITSRAYLPPQKIEQGTLEIQVVEAVTGDIEIKGNRYYKTKLIRRKLNLTKGEPFNYNDLKKGMVKINQVTDRFARAVLSPGKETGSTDILMDVKDSLPIHARLGWDNFGSRFVNRNRYTATVYHNNLLGFDDIFTLQYQISDSDMYRLTSARYLIPVSDGLQLGFFGANSRLSLGREFKDLNSRGKSKLYSIYAIQSLIKNDNLTLNLDLGFDYKDIFNFQGGNELSRDKTRAPKIGFDLDVSDAFGRTLLIEETNFGIPNILGGIRAKDPRASRQGSGGRFTKHTVNLLRLQKLPLGSTLLWKNQLQFSPNILTAAEQFQLGGIVNMRGYPPAEVVGDQGYSMAWELAFPPYFLPKDLKFPFSKAKVYDVLKFVGFYDWGTVNLKRPQAGEEKNKTLRSAGCGVRFNLPEKFSLRFEIAWPLDNTPSDGKHLHKWIEISKEF